MQLDVGCATCVFSIGGLGFAVECTDAALAAELTHRYRQFSNADKIHLTVRVQTAGQVRASASLDTSMAFSDGTVQFAAPGYEGFINAAQGEGRLALSSAQPMDDLDYYVRVACAVLAFQAGGLLFHAAGIVRGGWGYVFFGCSGSGKTTVSRLSPHDVVLNDDLVLLMPADRGWTVQATPFWNPSHVHPAGALAAPLAGLFHLVQDKQVYLETLYAAQAVAEVIASVPVIAADPSRTSQLLERGRRLVGATPVYNLHFLPDPSFWPVVEQTRSSALIINISINSESSKNNTDVANSSHIH